jgi:uncharacterized protein (TIGR03000 family)
MDSVPAVPADSAEPSTTTVSPMPETQSSVLMENGFLTVNVPVDAKIYVNNKLTTTPGSFRRYKTPSIKSGEALTYEVKAVYEKDGAELIQTKVVDLFAGGSKHVDFEFDVTPPPVTVLSLKVPENAEVKLAGNKTNATGGLRLFTTTTLKDGDSWKGYRIVVTTVINGQKVVKSKSIDLNAGASVDLAFDFGNESNKVAFK